MTSRIGRDARAVLFPAFDRLALSDQVRKFLGQGGVSILLGEDRPEYVARRMSESRRAIENAEAFARVTADARGVSDALLVAVDQEPAGICRLEGLVPPLPSADELRRWEPLAMEARSSEIARAATKLGINVFLAPILDVLDGENVWLNGRTWSDNPERVAGMSAAFIRGVQSRGVAATAKHFPGFRSVTADPAIDAGALCLASAEAVEAGLLPFRSAVEAGVEMVMVGPAPVVALDPKKTAFRSPRVVGKLRTELGFPGVIMADDLDALAAMRGDSIPEVAVDALNAGCDFLLLADIKDHLDVVAGAIERAVHAGIVAEDRLAASAERVRSLARRYAIDSRLAEQSVLA